MTEIPYGCCGCGCGEKTSISKKTDTGRGYVQGEPRRYVIGHAGRRRKKVADPYRAEDRGYETPCWIWQRSITGHGYGSESVYEGFGCSRSVSAHRWIYEQERGPIPEGLQLDHLCRVKSCVNPDHLEPVTLAENIRRGAGTKLNRETAEEIRTSPEGGRVIAKRLGVSEKLISDVRRGKSWVAA